MLSQDHQETLIDQIIELLLEGPATLTDLWMELDQRYEHRDIREALDVMHSMKVLRVTPKLVYDTWLPLYAVPPNKRTRPYVR